MDDNTKSWLVKGGAVVAGIFVLAVLMPFIYSAFLASLGLLGIGALAVVGIGLFKLLPYLGQKADNAVLSLRKAEARANPVEQLQNDLLRRGAQLNAFRSGLELIGGQIRGLENSLSEQERCDPEDDLSDQKKDLAKLGEFYTKKKKNYQEACDAFAARKKAIERYKFKWGFGTAAQGIAKAMNADDEKALVGEMLADEAFGSIDLRYNQAFAALDLDSVELSSAKQLTFGKTAAIDVQAIEIPKAQPALQLRNLR